LEYANKQVKIQSNKAYKNCPEAQKIGGRNREENAPKKFKMWHLLDFF
jgi:hypothetical protein